MKKLSLFTLILLITYTIPSFAWGKKGHAMVAEIAFTYLDPSVQQIVKQYLGDRSIQDAANWMDDVRDDRSLDYLKPYHYINFEKDTKVTIPHGDNVLYQLSKTIQELKNYKNLSNEEVKMKICILFHLVGDMHQPMHVGYGVDKGGNTVQINYNGKGTNLHSFFDSGIINARNISLNDCLAMNNYSKSKIKNLEKINVKKWAKESRSYLPSIYDFKGHVISENYVDQHSTIIKKQLLHAGIRLGGILEGIFGEK